MKSAVILSALVLAGLGATSALAQSVISAQSGMINYTEGKVLLNDLDIQVTSTKFPQVRVQDVLSTKEGRVEVLLNPGSFLRVGENSSIRLASSSLTRPSVELLSGSVVLEVAAESKDELVTLTWKDVVLSLAKHGVFRLDTDPAGLRVFDGEVSVTSAGHQLTLGKGKMLPFDGTWASLKFNPEQTDSLDRWSGRRASYLAMANPSAVGMPGGYRNSQVGMFSSAECGGSGLWSLNSFYGMMTYIPCRGIYNSYYGYRFYSPMTVGALYYVPRQPTSSSFMSGGGGSPSYSTNAATSGGTSGTIAASSPASTTSSSASSAPISRSSGNAGGRTR
jgi:hypothetical protein